jgi:hypothetical protein
MKENPLSTDSANPQCAILNRQGWGVTAKYRHFSEGPLGLFKRLVFKRPMTSRMG